MNDFFSPILLNPRMREEEQVFIRELIQKELKEELKEHVLIASSGSSRKQQGDFKFAALSKKALLTSAEAVNQHLNAEQKDIWLNTLPTFHVGGLGIQIRGFLTNSKIITLEKWDPLIFCSLIEEHLVTLTSLVPAQIYDLCQENIKPPKTLRAVIVGGGALAEELYKKARMLGWPLLISYGLTECASQVATSDNSDPQLKLLNHVEARVNQLGFLEIKSEALLSFEVLISDQKLQMHDPKQNGWFTTEDLASLENNVLTIRGRADDFIKIGGESVLFSSLEKKLEALKLALKVKEDAALIPYPDDRLGFVIHLVSVPSCTKNLVEAFNASCMPYERIRHIHYVSHIPRTPLKKLLRNDLLTIIKTNV